MTVLPRPRCASLAVLSSTLLHRPPPPPFLPSRPQLQLQLRPRPRTLTTTAALRTTYRRSQDFTSGFSSTYDPTEDEGRGPMFSKPTFGVPSFYPRDLKKRVDEYVVGQDRAKKTICSVIFNHYQNLRRRHHHDIQDQRMREKLQRQRFARDRDLHDRQGYADVHPVEDDFPGHNESVRGIGLGNPEPVDDFYVPEDPTVPQHVKIDKSNLLLLGPTGVGKTYILETLSKKLNVPFTISDCNSFTQAGYIGQDVETCIERLLIEANYDIKAAEHGIVVLDEFDKIARRETVNGRDVGGEGVQQALLKLVEGTKVTINVKDNRSSRPSPSSPLMGGGIGGSTGQPGSPPPSPPSGGGKVDQYTIDTTNILFVFCGAFVGLDKAVLKRVSKHSMGFGAEIRRAAAASASLQGSTDVLPVEMYAHLPHQPHPTVLPPDSSPFSLADTTTRPTGFTPLDLTTPTDLQAFGFIPELIGRVHNICALSPLSRAELLRVLTEPRNSLVAQYTALFETYPSRLRFTRRALRAVAERAARNETGARGLKMEMERVLAEPMFEAPTPYVLITEACVRGAEKAGYWGKDGGLEVERRIADEDRGLDEEDEEGRRRGGGERVVESSFEQFREAGLSGA